MHLIWALGQESGDYVHSPKSGLETEESSVPDFYRNAYFIAMLHLNLINLVFFLYLKLKYNGLLYNLGAFYLSGIGGTKIVLN